MNRIRTVYSALLLFASLAGVVFCLYVVSRPDELVGDEAVLIGIVLTICSSITSWILADFYAHTSSRAESTRLIDRIGEQASEKILNQSRQLWSVERFLDINGSDGKFKDYTVVESVIEMIRIIRSSNNTYLSDWSGVVSVDIKTRIDDQARAQAEIFEDLELIVKSDFEDESVKNRILRNIKKLPEHAVPRENLSVERVVSRVQQSFKRADAKEQVGRLYVNIGRSTYHYTASGKLVPEMIGAPDIKVRFTQVPDGSPDNISIFASTGTPYDFNIHVKSNVTDQQLPPGLYVAEYFAKASRRGPASPPPIQTENGAQSEATAADTDPTPVDSSDPKESSAG